MKYTEGPHIVWDSAVEWSFFLSSNDPQTLPEDKKSWNEKHHNPSNQQGEEAPLQLQSAAWARAPQSSLVQNPKVSNDKKYLFFIPDYPSQVSVTDSGQAALRITQKLRCVP